MKLLDSRKLIAISAVLAAFCVALFAGDMQTEGMMMKEGTMMPTAEGAK